jgi:hypothetical protein
MRTLIDMSTPALNATSIEICAPSVVHRVRMRDVKQQRTRACEEHEA